MEWCDGLGERDGEWNGRASEPCLIFGEARTDGRGRLDEDPANLSPGDPVLSARGDSDSRARLEGGSLISETRWWSWRRWIVEDDRGAKRETILMKYVLDVSQVASRWFEEGRIGEGLKLDVGTRQMTGCSA